MQLTPEQLKKLKDVFNQAVENHPTPDKPVMRVGQIKMSPRQLAKELEDETPIGNYFVRVIEDVVTFNHVPFDKVLAQFVPKPPKH